MEVAKFGPGAGTVYSSIFYALRSNGTTNGARHLLPMVLDLVQPGSLADVGCGTGNWLAVAREHGVSDVWGVDGPWVRQERLLIPAANFDVRDLRHPVEAGRRFDMVMSVEVAEHLPADGAEQFVANLCDLAPVVLFSAAIPGQGGERHVNEQWPSYWIRLFAARGYKLYDVLRPAIWREREIPYWYRQNAMFFVAPDAPVEVIERLKEFAALHGDYLGADLVHPEHAERALQYPGLGALARALPFAAVRSLSQLPHTIREHRAVAATGFAGCLVAAGALLLPAFGSNPPHQEIARLYEEHRTSAETQLFYIDEAPKGDGDFAPPAASYIAEADRAMIEHELLDNAEDFFVVEEGDAEDFQRLDRDKRLRLVAVVGDFRIYRDTPSA